MFRIQSQRHSAFHITVKLTHPPDTGLLYEVRIEGMKCLNCASICKLEEKVCKWCGKVLPESGGFKLTKEPEINATFWGALLSRGRIHPQRFQAGFYKKVIVQF